MENKLRIVHVIPSLAKGGAERIVIDICRQLQNTPGVEVKLVVFADVNTYKNITDGLDIHVIPSRYLPSILRKSVNETQELRKFFDSYKPHIIHTHLFEAEIACRATEYYDAVYVTHCHDNMPPYRKTGRAKYTNKKLIAWHYERRFVLNHAAKAKDNVFIAISTHTKDYFEHNLPAPFNQKVVLLLNAIDYNRFASRPLPTYPETGRFKLINVGSFNERKNQKLLIEVMEILGHQSAAAELVMLGDGAMRPEILTMIKKNGLELTASAPGNVENVEEYLSNSHIYVHSALYEPFGLVIVEAMAAGLPVVAIDGYGNRDLHKEGETGYLIEYPSALRVAERIGKLISDKNLYNSFTGKARKFAAQFDIVEYTGKLVGIYSQYTGIQL
jgi:glycosyltransferase involved in cell wall biosynthesis